jgi:D-glucosaminate-6-phosphate ammonia-lyase
MASFESLGVRRVVNASANNSRVGASCMSTAVLKSMCDAAHWYVDMAELHVKCSEVIERITGAEAGLVTSGAAGGLLLAVAACITRGDTAMMLDLPDAGRTAEVIVQKGQRTGYDQAIRMTGAKMVEVGVPSCASATQIEYAISSNTVAILYTFGETVSLHGLVPLQRVIAIGKAHNIPVVVDAAVAGYPPERLKSFVTIGADLVAVSGGKHIEGPPGTGFLFGRRDLIESCRMQAGPEDGIGRPLKVGKEEIVGLITALEEYVQRDHEAEQRTWEKRIDYLIQKLRNLPHAVISRIFPDEVGRPVPRVRIHIQEAELGLTAFEIVKYLAERDPAVRVTPFYLSEGVIVLNPVGLQEGDEDRLIDAIWSVWRSGPGSSR